MTTLHQQRPLVEELFSHPSRELIDVFSAAAAKPALLQVLKLEAGDRLVLNYKNHLTHDVKRQICESLSRWVPKTPVLILDAGTSLGVVRAANLNNISEKEPVHVPG